MTKKLIVVMMCCFFAVFLSGCDLIRDPKLLMSVPKLPSDKENLKGLISSELPKGANIIRPKHFKDSSAIRITDLNKDGIKEAVVFYETPDQEVRIHGMIWENVGDTWVRSLDFDGEGTQLESFELLDVTGDGNFDIIAGYSNADLEQQNGLVVVYNYKGESLNKVLELPYYEFVTNDINMDSVNEVSIITKKQDQMFTLTTYRYLEEIGSFKELSSLNLDNEIESYYHVSAGRISAEREGIVLDARVNSFQGYTSVVIFEDGKLQEAVSREKTQKSPTINSTDVDGDGIIEIGMQEIPKGWENKSLLETPWFIKYYQWSGIDKLKLIQLHYREENVYTLKFPTEWNDIISVDPLTFTKNYIRFINVKNDNTLAEVRKFPATLWDQYKNNWKFISRSGDLIYAVQSDVDLKTSKAKMDNTLTKKGIGGNENR